MDGQQYHKGLFLQRLVVLPRIPRFFLGTRLFWNCGAVFYSLHRRGMRRVVTLLSCLAIGFTPGCALHRSAAKSLTEKRTREKEARAAATEWLALIDAADYAAAHALEPKRLRAATTEIYTLSLHDALPI